MSETRPINSQMPTALITGATGFVGNHLARRLVQEGWQVHVLIRADSKVPTTAEFSKISTHSYDGSTTSVISCVESSKPDIVFHLASIFLAQHQSKDIEALILSNVLLGTQLLQAMRVNGINNIVSTGTSWQHYKNEEYNPVCLYAATKQAFEIILEYYVQACGIKAITLKLFDTYGSEDSRPKLFNLLGKASINGDLLDMSTGDQLIDLVYIDDVIDAYIIAAKRLSLGKVSGQEFYAVSSGNPLSLKSLVELYAKINQKKIKINWGARPYRVREVMIPWSKGIWIPGWRPRVGLVEGLKRL
jgi:nucleoside-diphosphate-sugar epimerase